MRAVASDSQRDLLVVLRAELRQKSDESFERLAVLLRNGEYPNGTSTGK